METQTQLRIRQDRNLEVGNEIKIHLTKTK